MKYVVKFTSEGLLSGKNIGDQVSFDDADTQHLLNLDLIEPEADYQARQEAKAQAEQAEPAPTGSPLSLSQIISPERMAELMTEEEDRLLEPHKGNGGWYEFPPAETDGKPVKVQGRAAAVEEFVRRLEAEHVESGDSANGQHPNP